MSKKLIFVDIGPIGPIRIAQLDCVNGPIREARGHDLRAGSAQRFAGTVFVIPNVRIPATRADSIPGGESSIAKHSRSQQRKFPLVLSFLIQLCQTLRDNNQAPACTATHLPR